MSRRQMSRDELVAALNRAMRDAADRRKVLVAALPAVERRVLPLFKPMEHATLSALSTYDDKELALLLNFFVRAHEAAVAAMAMLRAETTASKKGKARRAKTATANRRG